MDDLTLRPVRVGTASADEDGRLVLSGERLVAVLVRLDDAIHTKDRGRRHLEAGFSPYASAQPVPFADLDAALTWIANRLAPRRSLDAGGPPAPSSAPDPKG